MFILEHVNNYFIFANRTIFTGTGYIYIFYIYKFQGAMFLHLPLFFFHEHPKPSSSSKATLFSTQQILDIIYFLHIFRHFFSSFLTSPQLWLTVRGPSRWCVCIYIYLFFFTVCGVRKLNIYWFWLCTDLDCQFQISKILVYIFVNLYHHPIKSDWLIGKTTGNTDSRAPPSLPHNYCTLTIYFSRELYRMSSSLLCRTLWLLNFALGLKFPH